LSENTENFLEVIMNQYLYLLKPTRLGMVTEGPTESEQRIVTDHFNYLQQLLADGSAVLFGRTTNDDENTLGLVIFEAQDDGAAGAIMESDPAVQHGVMTATLLPYRIAGMRSA